MDLMAIEDDNKEFYGSLYSATSIMKCLECHMSYVCFVCRGSGVLKNRISADLVES